MADPNWKELADAVLRIWTTIGWKALIGAAVVALLWKTIDAWGKKPKS